MADSNKKKTKENKKSEKIKKVELEDFKNTKSVAGNNSLELLMDIPLKVVVELGRTEMKINDLMEMGVGSIIELDKLSGEPVDVYVNGKPIAKGEVVVIDEDFGVRITEINMKAKAKNVKDSV